MRENWRAAKLILADTLQLIKRDLNSFFGLTILVAALVAVVQQFGGDHAANLIGGPASFVVGVVLVFRSLQRLYPDDTTMQPRVPSLFGLNILVSLAVILGLILLVIPGIFLFVRWFIAWPIVIRERVIITEALRISWRITRGREWSILFATLIIFFSALFALLFASIVIAVAHVPSENSLLFSFVINAEVYFPIMFLNLASVACYESVAKERLGAENKA